jgi:serine/threonine protein kinase
LATKSQRDALLQTIEKKPHLNDRFEGMQRIDAEGGGGNFSLVLKARDRHTSRDVALKFFDPQKLTEKYRWESFKREVELLPRFDGKQDILQCICPLTEFKEPFENALGIVLHVDFAYFAIELAAYDANAAIINKVWSIEQKLFYFKAMCRAVQRVHAASIAHRDLKPSNFLIMPNGELRLSDFGTARVISGVNNAIAPAYGWPPGDIGYAPPEMIAALHDVDAQFAFRGDVYALGAILFELFTGARLNLQVFDGATIGALNKMLTAVPPEQRVSTYDGFVASMASSHPLPSVGLFGGDVPGSILELLNQLYMSLAALDYHARLMDFQHLFMQINRCIYVHQHEAAYRRWRERKRQWKANSKTIGQSK